MAFSVTVHQSEVEGERCVELRKDGVLRGNIFARSVEQALTRVEDRMRQEKAVGLIIREVDIEALLDQLRERWR